MAENKWVRVASLTVTALLFATLTVINHTWTIAPVLQNCGLVYELSEFTLLASIIATSVSAGVITEVAGMLLGQRIAEKAEEKAQKAQAEADERVRVAEAKASAEVRAAQAEARAAEARAEAAEAKAQLANGAKPQATENVIPNGGNMPLGDFFKYLAAEREREAARDARMWEVLQNAGLLNGSSVKEDAGVQS